MFGLQNNFVRETLPSDLKLTLQTAIEKVRLVKLTNAELQPIKADQQVAEEASCWSTWGTPLQKPWSRFVNPYCEL